MAKNPKLPSDSQSQSGKLFNPSRPPTVDQIPYLIAKINALSHGDALLLDGTTSMTGQIKAADGSTATPSITFASDTDLNTGFYRPAEGEIGVVFDGVEVLRLTANTLAIGTDSPTSSAALDVSSTTRGFLPPRMSTTERNAVSSPVEGLIVWDTTDNALYQYSGSAWEKLKVGGASKWTLWVPLHGTQVQDMGTGTMTNAGVGIVSSSDYDGHSVAANWGGSSKEGFAWSFIVPSDLDTSQAVTAKLYFRLSGTPGTRHSVDCGLEARAVADNEVSISGGTSFSVTTTKEVQDEGYSSGDLVITSLGDAFGASTLDAGDYVKGVVYRDGTTDSYTGTCQFVGVLFEGAMS